MDPTVDRFEGPRACREHEIGIVVELANEVMKETFGEMYWYGQNFSFMYCRKNMENIRVIRVGNRLVSSATIFPYTMCFQGVDLNIAAVSTVVTDPAFRGRGYNSLLMKDCLEKMRTDGIDAAFLNTSIPDYYRKFGWEYAGCEYTYKLDKGNIELLPDLYSLNILECSPNRHLKELTALYGSMKLGALRTEEDFFLRVFEKRYTSVFAAEKGGKLHGYAVLAGNTVMEHAGAPEITAGLIKALFHRKSEELDRKSTTDLGRKNVFKVHCPAIDGHLGGYLNRLNIPKDTGYFGMMVILNPGQLLGKLTGGAVVLESENERDVILVKDGIKYPVNKKMLPKLFFGPEKTGTLQAEGLPAGFYIWMPDLV